MYHMTILISQVKHYVEYQLRLDIDAPVDESHNTQLHYAVQTGDEKEVLQLLKKGANVDITNMNRVTPLHVAVDCGYPKLIDLLLEHGAWTEAENADGLKPIHMVKKSPKLMECLEKLLSFGGADVNGRDANGNNLLHLIISLPISNDEKKIIVKLLIDEDIDLNAENVMGETPLHKAIFQDNAQIVSILLRNGARLEVNYKDLSLFDLAVEGNHINSLHIMIKHVIIRKLRGQRVDENVMQKIYSNNDFISLYQQFEYEFESLRLLRYNNCPSFSYYEAWFGRK